METIPILGDIESLTIVGLLASLMLFFMLRYFSKQRQYEDCLKEKSATPSPPIEEKETGTRIVP